MPKVKRSLFKTFLNTGTIEAPVWSLIGRGVTAGSIAYNPKVEEEHYIHEDSATAVVESYSPKYAIEASAIAGDAVYDYLDALRIGRSVFEDVVTEAVNVWAYKTPIAGYYPAERALCSVQVDEFGGEGGAAVKLNYTVNLIGDPTPGRLLPGTTPLWSNLKSTSDATTLATLTLGSGTLSPLFASDKTNLFYTTSIAAATVSLKSTKAGAVIVQKCNGDVVAQEADATLVMGANTITIEVTAGGVTDVYVIQATRTE